MVLKVDITKYAAVIIDKKGRYLLVKDKEEDFWKNVGGKPLPDETPEQCLRREIEEELSVEVLGVPKYYFSSPVTPAANDVSKTVQIILYKVEIDGEPVCSSEIGSLHWVTKEEFVNNTMKVTLQLEEFILPRLVKDMLLK